MDAWTASALHFAQARCARCALLISQPQASEAEIEAYYRRAYYEEQWPDPEAIWARNVELCRRHELPLMERLWAAWPPPPGARVAEVGCGYGVLMHVMREAGFRPRGADPSPRAVAECRRRGLPATDGRSPGLPWPVEAFDVAIGRHVVEHVTDPRALVKEMVGLVRPGGLIVLVTEDAWNSQYAWHRLRAHARGRLPAFRSSTDHTFVFDAGHLRALLAEAGCEATTAAAFSLPPAHESLHWRLYKGLFRRVDRLLGHGEFLMAVGRRSPER